MKYPRYPKEANAVLDVARAAVRLKRFFADFTPGVVIQDLVEPAAQWSWSLVDIIMDYEQQAERRAALVRRFRRAVPPRPRRSA